MKKSFCVARPLWLAVASCVVSSHVFAQIAPFELRPVTVTGSGMPRTLGSEIAATSVLTRGDIERSGARDMVQVLNLLGTALVEQQGGPGTAAFVRLRGADSRDTLASTARVARLPAPALSCACRSCEPRRVKIWITPPVALAP